MSDIPDKPGRGPATCPKCKKGTIIALFTGFADGESPVFTNGDTGPIEDVGSRDWDLRQLMCTGGSCDWELGDKVDDPEDVCEKFLKKLEKKAK